MTQLTTAQRIVIGFAIAPLALVGLVFYALHDLATLKQQRRLQTYDDLIEGVADALDAPDGAALALEREATFRRQQGVPYIRFVMDREGKVLSVRLERSSGYRPLDDEAVALPKRAQPLPKPPEDVKGETVELVVPVEFFMR